MPHCNFKVVMENHFVISGYDFWAKASPSSGILVIFGTTKIINMNNFRDCPGMGERINGLCVAFLLGNKGNTKCQECPRTIPGQPVNNMLICSCVFFNLALVACTWFRCECCLDLAS